jgi:deoxyadenosine/deoxycytidine kinase
MIIIEVIGLAGSGKSTLTSNMSKSIENCSVSYRLPRLRGSIRFMFGTLRGLPLILTPGKSRLCLSHWYLLGHFEAMIHDLIRRHQTDEKTVLILDQGPIFEFVSIKRYMLSGKYGDYLESLYSRLLKQFYARADAIVYLHAPDAVLLQRVKARAVGHLLKNMPVESQRTHMEFYHAEYDQVLQDALAASVPVVKLDTQVHGTEELLPVTLAALAEQGVLLSERAN